MTCWPGRSRTARPCLVRAGRACCVGQMAFASGHIAVRVHPSPRDAMHSAVSILARPGRPLGRAGRGTFFGLTGRIAGCLDRRGPRGPALRAAAHARGPAPGRRSSDHGLIPAGAPGSAARVSPFSAWRRLPEDEIPSGPSSPVTAPTICVERLCLSPLPALSPSLSRPSAPRPCCPSRCPAGRPAPAHRDFARPSLWSKSRGHHTRGDPASPTCPPPRHCPRLSGRAVPASRPKLIGVVTRPPWRGTRAWGLSLSHYTSAVLQQRSASTADSLRRADHGEREPHGSLRQLAWPS